LTWNRVTVDAKERVYPYASWFPPMGPRKFGPAGKNLDARKGVF
jgi:hypothetical protein